VKKAIPISKRKSAPTFTAKDKFRTHKRGAIVLLPYPAKPELLHHIRQARPRLPDVMPRKGLKRKSRKPPQWAEELERKAWFFAKQKMRPKSKKCLKSELLK
jgi:hypothetical protein